MAMVAVAGYVDKMVTVGSTAVTLLDLGFTDEQIKSADSAHISVTRRTIRYWYTGSIPTASEGHPIYEGAERIIRGKMNIRHITLISETGLASVAITLGSFSRTT
jgi:hypothetical protein